MLCHNADKNAMKLSVVKYLNMNATNDTPTQQSTKFFSPLLISPIFFDMWKT